MDNTQSFAKYPAGQVAQMAIAAIKSIHSARRNGLKRVYSSWALKQNARTFNWFGLTKLEKYPLVIDLPVEIIDFDKLPPLMKKCLLDVEGDYIWAELHYNLLMGGDVLKTAYKILNMTENLIRNEQITDKTIYLSAEDFNIINSNE